MRQPLPSKVMMALGVLLTLFFVPWLWSLPGIPQISNRHGLLQASHFDSRADNALGIPITVQNNGEKTAKVLLTGLLGGEKAILRKRIGSDQFDWFMVNKQNNGTVGPGYTLFIPVESHETQKIFVPGVITSGRMYVSEEWEFPFNTGDEPGLTEPAFDNPSDPSYEKNFGFMEFTSGIDTIWINLTFVDFVGLALGLSVKTTDDYHVVKGPKNTGVQDICEELEQISKETQEPGWNELCLRKKQDGTPLRVLAPFKKWSTDTNPATGWMPHYYDGYIDQVWEEYRDGGLRFEMEPAAKVCQTSGPNLVCDGVDTNIAKPNTTNVFGCEGPFGDADKISPEYIPILSILCAAFHRSTLLLPGGIGATQPSPKIPVSKYYQGDITNQYAKTVHRHLEGGVGYAFPFEEVTGADGADQEQSSLREVAKDTIESIRVQVGGWKD